MALFDFLKKTYTDKRGYRRFRNSNKPVHRWIASKKLGRKLRKGEVVHHKDRKKLNNRPGNLWVFKSQKDHDRVHKSDARKYGKTYSYIGKAVAIFLSLLSLVIILL